MSSELLRSIPSIDRLLSNESTVRLTKDFDRDRVRGMLREISDELRKEINSGIWPVTVDGRQNLGATTRNTQSSVDYISAEIDRRLARRAALTSNAELRRVINATGVIIHTNLGRAPFANAAVAAMAEVASHYSNLEYDLALGARGRRESYCQRLLSCLTGGEAAVVTNNNAAAVLLVLDTYAEGGEVIVSRGELVEIGGGFRIPEVMEKSGARLREVGTTNRTRIDDYERAINADTRLLLRVHPSNFRITGFVKRPTVSELASLGRRTGVPVFEDLGSGCLLDISKYGVTDEPVIAQSVRAGISIVSFSGDKMVGGPQAGIIVGQKAMIERLRANPLMRALRADKITYAALEATLRLYEMGRAEAEVPVIRDMAATVDCLRMRATSFARRISTVLGDTTEITLEEGESVIGAGSAPHVTLPTVLASLKDKVFSAATLHKKLRSNVIPIITRTEKERILIDLRTVAKEEEEIILEALLSIRRSEMSGHNRRYFTDIPQSTNDGLMKASSYMAGKSYE